MGEWAGPGQQSPGFPVALLFPTATFPGESSERASVCIHVEVARELGMQSSVLGALGLDGSLSGSRTSPWDRIKKIQELDDCSQSSMALDPTLRAEWNPPQEPSQVHKERSSLQDEAGTSGISPPSTV